MSKAVEFTGTVADVFAHRFTLATGDGKKLIDLGPGGEKGVKIEAGQEISVKGDEKPGEVKAHEVRIGDGEWQPVKVDEPRDSKPPHGKDDDEKGGAKPALEPELEDEHVTKLLDEAGYTDHGERERKPKHVEVIASKDGQRHKVHVHKDGVKKAEPVA